MKSEECSIVSRFAQIVAEHPGRTAVVDAKGAITYRELNAAANALAAKIVPRKRPGENFVVTVLPRTRQFPIAAMAAHKAGVAYVPVNPAYPDDRLNDILGQTQAILFVTTSEIWNARKAGLKVPAGDVLLVDAMAVDPSSGEIDESDWDKAALVIFTSGTTGRPKGVVHTLRSVTATAVAFVGRRDLVGRPRRYALVSDFSFIATTVILYDCLWTGGELHVVDEDVRMNLADLAAYFNDRRIDISLVVTSMCVTLLNDFSVKGMEELQLGSEKMAGLGKEAVGSLRLMHLYGMSEMMPISEFRLEGGEQPPPVGRVIGEDGRLYVLDGDMRKVPSGTIGDIYVGSPRMAREYLGQPELSAERFVDDPFAPGKRLLRTGDRGYVDAHGDLVLCGRSDNMVPSRFIRLEKLPRNARGKLDRAALPDPVVDFASEMVPPENDGERTLLGIAQGLIGTDRFGVTDDLFALGMTSLMAMRLAVESGKAGFRLKTSDLMKYRTIRATLRHRTSMVWWYEPYDSLKDVAVFVHGIALTKNIEQKIRMLNEHYNVLVVEPIQEHYHHVFEGDDIEEVVALYCALIDYYLPAEAKVRVATGVSWGGKLAYLIACRLQADRGQLPAVVMGDSVIAMKPDLTAAALNGTLSDWEAKNQFKLGDSFRERLIIASKIESHGVTLPRYAGRVILLHSLKPRLYPAGNDEAWRRIVDNLSVVRLPFRHDEISLDNEMTMPTWRTVERAIRLWDRMTQDKEEMEAVWRDEVVAAFRPRTEKILSSLELLEDDGAAAGPWREAAGGTGLFYRLDAAAIDCKKLFVPVWPIEPQRFVWWLGLFTGEYFFRPEESPAASYATRDDGTALEIATGGGSNTWVYLPSRETYPTTYALEFDYTVHQPLKETLQLCFCFDSLAERLRFVLNDNASLGFEVVKSGMFPSVRDKALWASCRRPCSIPLGRPVRVRLEVDGDTFRLSFDGTQAMAARYHGFEPHPARWAIIAWNGFGTSPMKVKIENPKVYVRDEK